jgi:hypothetical protein
VQYPEEVVFQEPNRGQAFVSVNFTVAYRLSRARLLGRAVVLLKDRYPKQRREAVVADGILVVELPLNPVGEGLVTAESIFRWLAMEPAMQDVDHSAVSMIQAARCSVVPES